MKITIVLGAFFPVPPILGGAVEKVWFALGREFVRRGHEVVQISRAHPSLPPAEEIDGVQHRRVRGYDQPKSIVRLKWRDLLYARRVSPLLPRADILVTNTFWLPLLVRQKDRGRLYVHVARMPKGQISWYRKAARLQAVSRAIGDAIVAQAPQMRAKVRVLPNALPFELAALPNESQSRTILFVGRLHPEKGIEMFLQALAVLGKAALAGWKIKIVGPHEIELGGGGADFLRAMQTLGQRSGAELEWPGKIFEAADLQAQYRSAQFFIYPSIAETGEAMPVAPLEAMANGCVPIVSDLACFRDYIRDRVNGFVFDHRGPTPEKNLAGCLTTALQLEAETFHAMRQSAYAQASEFAVENIAPRYLADFADLLQK